MFRLKIDNREKKLIEILATTKPPLVFDVVQLAIGDIVIESSVEKCPILIIERKTLSDLSSSIFDGRYKEQSHRLNGIANHHNHNSVYLIEGNMFRQSKDRERLYSSLFSLQFYKGFSVVRTGSVEESALWLTNAMKKLQREPTKPFFYKMASLASSLSSSLSSSSSSSSSSCDEDINNDVVDNKQDDKDKNDDDDDDDVVADGDNVAEQCRKRVRMDKSYTELVKTVKKQNITETNIDACMLCQIPDVSGKVADALIQHFGSLLLLKTKMEEDNKYLDSFILPNNRKIGKNVVANLRKFLHVS